MTPRAWVSVYHNSYGNLYWRSLENEQRNIFLRRMVKIGFLHFTNAPTESSQKSIPSDINTPPPLLLDQRDKTVVFFHDESTFSSYEDQNIMWGEKGQTMIKMTCMDFWHPDDEYEEAKKLNPNIRKYAREFLEYGESREGYWNCDKFIRQTERAASIAELKYSKSAGWRHVYVFDHSSCQAMADDALDVNQMNVKP